MTFEQANAELTILRGLADSGADLALVKERIERLYLAVCNKVLRRCNCKDKYRDALIEIYVKLKYYASHMDEYKATARLVNGVVLFVDGKHYTNSNLTDDVARAFLAKFPQRSNWFAILPSAEGSEPVEEAVEKMPENGSQVAPKATKPASQATTPKKGKSPKKRK